VNKNKKKDCRRKENRNKPQCKGRTRSGKKGKIDCSLKENKNKKKCKRARSNKVEKQNRPKKKKKISKKDKINNFKSPSRPDIFSNRQITGDTTSCVEKLRLYGKLFSTRAQNIIRQVTRIKNNDKIQKGKQGKKGEFNETLTILTDALGGDAKNPTCEGKPFDSSNSTSRDKKKPKESLETLKKCNTEIQDKCKTRISDDSAKAKILDDCKKFAELFKKEFEPCQLTNITADATCKCVEKVSAENVASLQNAKCTLKKDNADALKNKKTCKAAFAKCKSAKGDSVSGINSCREKVKCAGYGKKKDAEKALKKLNELKKALDNPAMMNALKKLGLDKGAGDDGKVPTGRFMEMDRSKRQADGAGCTSLVGEWDKFNKSAEATGKSPNDPLNPKGADDTIKTLDGINGRSTLEDDLKSCATTRQGKTPSIVIIRIRIFWCVWWQNNFVQIQITIIVASFNLGGGGGSGTTAPPLSTAAPKSRNLLLHQIIRRSVENRPGMLL